MSFKPVAEVIHTDEGVGDSQDDEDDSENGKRSKGATDGVVAPTVSRLVDADELEKEVGEAAKVEQDDEAHADAVFAAGKEGGAQQDHNGDGNGGDVQAEFDIVEAVDDDEELHGEPEEEEEIKLEKRDVDLSVCPVSDDQTVASFDCQLTW